MPHLKKCSVCGTALLDRDMCSDCLIKKYEDLLSRIHAQLEKNYRQALPARLAYEILRGSYNTSETREDKQRADVRKRNQKFLQGIMTSAASMMHVGETEKVKQ